MRNSLIGLVLGGVLGGMLASFDAQATDLLQVYREALANDAPFASARAALQAGQEKSVQGRAGLLPTAGLSGSYTRNSTNTSSSANPAALGALAGNPAIAAALAAQNGSTSFSGNSYTLSLSQPLFRVANWEQYQQGKLSVAASEAQFEQARQDLIVRVAQAYFDVLGAQDALATVQAQKIAITEQLASAKRNFEVGTATITDTHEAQARYDLTSAQEIAARNDLEIKRTALQQIIGKPPGELASLRPGVTITSPEPAGPDKWVESAEQQNYGVVGQQLALEIAQRDIKRNRAAHYPTVDLVASRTHSNSANPLTIDSVSDTNTIGVQWAIPLFSGFAVDSKVREAIALTDKARADLENARRVAAQGARQAYLGVTAGLAQVKALEAAEVSSQSALESNRLGYQVGVRINIDVLNAQQQLYSTRRDLAKARYDTLVNSLRLKSAAGTLGEDDLAQINALLKP
jgi:outer membrane protein